MDTYERLRYTGYEIIERRISSYWDRGHLTRTGFSVLKEYIRLDSEFLAGLICAEMCIKIKEFPDVLIDGASRRLSDEEKDMLIGLERKSFKKLEDDLCEYEGYR